MDCDWFHNSNNKNHYLNILKCSVEQVVFANHMIWYKTTQLLRRPTVCLFLLLLLKLVIFTVSTYMYLLFKCNVGSK